MRKYKILVIDYEPRSVEQIRRALAGDEHEVEFASDAIEGIQSFHRMQPDLTLIEAMIPKKHGFEVCQELKQTPHGKATPVLVITGVYRGRKYRHQAVHHYGANGYIEKPVSDDELREVVREALRTDEPPADEEPRARPVDTPDVAAAPAPPPPSGPRGGASVDPTELEIIERLDSLIPGGSGPGAAGHDNKP